MAAHQQSPARGTVHSQATRSLGAPIGLRALARVCHNIGTGLHAGVDIRRVLETEAMRGSARKRSKMSEIRDRVARGGNLAEAMKATGGYFPPLVCDMVDIGEKTGRTEQVLLRLGEHYDQMLRLRRDLLMGLAWPLFQFTLAIMVVGGYIWIVGMVWSGQGPPPMTVFGLYGTSGAITYFGSVAAIVALFVLLAVAVQNRWISIDPLMHLLIYVPGIGTGLRILALSRLSWSLAIATESGLDPNRAIELSVRTTQNTYYTMYIDQMVSTIVRGGEMHAAFAGPRIYPDDFLDALQTGEIAGRISESMHVIAKEYEGRAKNFMRILAVVAGVVILILIGALIIFMIFNLFAQYLGILNESSAV